jgi:release factor glutamine methyltransferase
VKTQDALAEITKSLQAAGIENPRREARYLLAAAHHITTTQLLNLEQTTEQTYLPYLTRRLAHEPLAYITGRKEFWGLTFKTSKATLIPRPDSETLITAALETFPHKNDVQNILDLGTGTGCLLLAALTEFPHAFGIGTDISPEAAALAQSNAKSLALSRRALFVTADWAAPLKGRKFDLILSNPPYIPTATIPSLMQDVQKYEPSSALDGGLDGLTAYNAIIKSLPTLLAPAGAAILELGINQADSVQNLAQTAGFTTKIREDLAKIPRALIIRP